MKGESKEKKITKVRVLRRENEKGGMEREKLWWQGSKMSLKKQGLLLWPLELIVLFSKGGSKMMGSRTRLRSMKPKSHSPRCLTLWSYMGFKSRASFCCVHIQQN